MGSEGVGAFDDIAVGDVPGRSPASAQSPDEVLLVDELPESLDELVEEGILPSVPMDMFADKPLRYDPERRLIWSVGPDEVDDGGEGDPENWRESKDYVLQLPQ